MYNGLKLKKKTLENLDLNPNKSREFATGSFEIANSSYIVCQCNSAFPAQLYKGREQ